MSDTKHIVRVNAIYICHNKEESERMQELLEQFLKEIADMTGTSGGCNVTLQTVDESGKAVEDASIVSVKNPASN